MINAFRSEWVKLRRRPMLLGGLGAMAGVSALASFIAVSSAGSTGTGPGGRFATLTGADLTAAGGLAQVLSGGATLLGVVALCVVAAAVAGDFSHGTLRGQLIREPRRFQLLAGKFGALLSFVAAGVALATIAAALIAPVVASTAGFDTGAWWSTEGFVALAGSAAKLLLAATGYATVGALLALVMRSPAIAIGVGVAWLLPFEQILSAAVPDSARLLPGQLLSALAGGGTTTVSWLAAAGTLAVYAAVTIPAASLAFARRDVTT